MGAEGVSVEWGAERARCDRIVRVGRAGPRVGAALPLLVISVVVITGDSLIGLISLGNDALMFRRAPPLRGGALEFPPPSELWTIGTCAERFFVHIDRYERFG